MDRSHNLERGTGIRQSTARLGNSPFLAVCFQRLPQGRILNLGAGGTSATTDRRVVVNVDHVEPAERGTGIFVVADACALPFRCGSFDGVLAKDVLEHVQEPVSVLIELHRTIHNDGALLVTVPRAIARAVWDDPTHVRGFTQNALRTAFWLSGWESDAPIRKVGAVPGAGRLRLTARLDTILRVPGFGHWFGTNWMVLTRPSPVTVTNTRARHPHPSTRQIVSSPAARVGGTGSSVDNR